MTPIDIVIRSRAETAAFIKAQGEISRITQAVGQLQATVNAGIGIDLGRRITEAWASRGSRPTPEARKRASFVEGALWSMSPDMSASENEFDGTIYDILDAWGKGIALLEIDWEMRYSPHGWAPRATRYVHPHYYGYSSDSDRLMLNGKLEGVKAPGEMTSDGFVPLPEDKFLVCIAKQKSGSPVTSAMLRPLAFWWCVSNFSAEWMLNFAQIFGIPIRWATYDPSKPGLLEQVSEMLENMGSAGWAAFPSGTTLEMKEAAQSGQDNPQAYLLNLADRICDILILGQTLTTDVGQSGSRALGSVHQSVRADVIQAAGDFVARVLNIQLIPAICRLNYGDANECPWLMPSLKETDAKAKAERDVLLAPFMEMPREWFYNRHDIPIPEDGEQIIGGLPPRRAGRAYTVSTERRPAAEIELVPKL